MPIETDKPLKTCKYCGKQYANLATHIINSHPSIMEQLNETTPINTREMPKILENTPLQQQNRAFSSINEMIREKLDTMLNIKIIEMLSANKEMSLIDLKKTLEPQKNTTLQELKEYHDLVYGSVQNNESDNGNQWLELANNALPIIKEMLPKKAEGVKNVERVGTEKRDLGIHRLVSSETPNDRGKPSNIGGKPSDTPGTE